MEFTKMEDMQFDHEPLFALFKADGQDVVLDSKYKCQSRSN